MLALLIGLLSSAGLILQGSWDIWAQSLMFMAAAGGSACWLLGRVMVGYIPLPPKRLVLWAGLLAVLSGLAAYLSPVSSYAVANWRVILLGLWIFCAMAAVSKDDRIWIDQAARAAGWFLMLLAFYQHYREGMERPTSALLNQNVFAGSVLMLLPLAVQQRDWFLSAGLIACLCWSRSVGAWMGLAAALVLTRRSRDAVGNYVGMAVFFVCLVLIYGKLQSSEVLHRWYWWRAAMRMAAERPWLGFGPGAYATVAPSYFDDPQKGLSALFAHEHFLETAAECGWLYLAAWIGGILYFLKRGSPHKKFGALAVLIQSLWDYPLSIPGNYWIFCYLAASTTPQSSRGLNVPYARKAPWALGVSFLAATACWWAGRGWRADILKASAIEGFRDGRSPTVSVTQLERSLALQADPEAERALAEILLAQKPYPPAESARAAVAHLERSARLNPYRASTWTALERLYGALGEAERGRQLRHEGEAYCPVLRLRSAAR